MKLFIETGPPGDHEPEEIEIGHDCSVAIVSRVRCIEVTNHVTGELKLHMHGEDWEELRLVNDLEI